MHLMEHNTQALNKLVFIKIHTNLIIIIVKVILIIINKLNQ